MLDGGILFCAVRHARHNTADLVDHLGLIGAERRMRVGMLGVELERGQQRLLDLASETLRERLDDGDALAVAAQRERIEVMRVGVLGGFAPARIGERGGLFEQRDLRLVRFLEIVGVHACALTAAFTPAPPAERPASTACSNSPA